MQSKPGELFSPTRSVYFGTMLAFIVATFLIGQYWLAAVEFGVMVVLLLLYVGTKSARDKRILKQIQSDENTMESAAKGESPLPAVLVRLSDSKVIWTNSRFAALVGSPDDLLKPILEDMIPGLGTEWLTAGKTEAPRDVEIGGRFYRAYGAVVRGVDGNGSKQGVIYLADLTELYQIRAEYVRSRPVVSIILIDNYEELIKNLTEGGISKLNAQLNDAIAKWTDGYHGILRKLDRNRFLFVFEKRDLDRIKDAKFSLVESVHEILNPSGMAASVSIGMGVDAVSFEEGYDFAALAIEMALSRGGDQAVIKDRYNFSFYGGRSKEADYRSKVRSRVTANSLMELMGKSDHIFIMGHKNADLDAVGAAVGIACLCRKRKKRFSIVLDMENNMAKELISELQQTPEYANAFISGQDAVVMSDNRSVLVVVDTNRPDQVEYQPLLEAITKICVVDHHRRAADYITPVVVNLHETYASSASELVTELLTYGVESMDVLPIEAKALLAGICLDTKFFNVRCGERTFEAAAALNRLGADTTEVKLLLQNDYTEIMTRYRILESASIYRENLMIAAMNSAVPRVLAAQAADEMLNITGISASFVLYPSDDKIFVSARSVGTVNVQMILEPLGGGGNTATAGAQIPGMSVDEVLTRLKKSIDKFYEN